MRVMDIPPEALKGMSFSFGICATGVNSIAPVSLPADGGDCVMIYFIQSGTDGPIKIGSSDDPKARMRELQSANPRKLRIIGCIGGYHPIESYLHRRFAHLRTDGGQEWFECAPELLEYATIHTTDDVPDDLREMWERDADGGLDAIVTFWTHQESFDFWWGDGGGCQLELWADVRPLWMRSYDRG